MIFNAEHGMLELSGAAFIANLVGLVVVGFAIICIRRARRKESVAAAMFFALVGIAIVICGTTVVIACE
jgi:hypothetical protein